MGWISGIRNVMVIGSVLGAMALAACASDAGGDGAAAGTLSSGGRYRGRLEGTTTLQVGVAAARTVRITTAEGADPGALAASAAFIHTAMNHGGLTDPTAKDGGAGTIEVLDLQPSMEGTWRMTLSVQDAAKVQAVETVDFDFTVTP